MTENANIWSSILTHLLRAVVAFAVLIAVVFGLSRCGHEDPEPIVLHDTISVHDTLRITQHTKPREVIRYDTIWLIKDSIKRDTAYALAPITQSEYRDTFATDSTRAEVAVLFSGYNARIDSVGINYQATIQPLVERKKKGWGWCVMPSVQVGYGVAFGQPVVAAPYVGIGIAIGWGYHW